MDFNEQREQLTQYLDKIYVVKENRFFRKYDEFQEWGRSITYSLATIFSFDHEFCVMNFKYWSEQQGLDKRNWDLAWNQHQLKAQWNLQMVTELEFYGVSDAEQQIITILSNELSREIDTKIINELRKNIKTLDEFIGLVKCVGYEPTKTIYNQHTHKPQKGFVSMNQTDIKNERQINPYWQDWVRARGQDKKA